MGSLVYRFLPYRTYSSYKCLGARSLSLYDMWADAVYGQFDNNNLIKVTFFSL
jgi:hypothetical protein